MTKTPEERANKIWGQWRGSRHEGRTLPLRALIASAIREAEDAALERAAVRLGEQSEDQLMTRWGVAAKRFASDIRALKHNKD